VSESPRNPSQRCCIKEAQRGPEYAPHGHRGHVLASRRSEYASENGEGEKQESLKQPETCIDPDLRASGH
jgi:hypothetical protein